MEFLSREKFTHLIGHLSHAAVIRKKDKSASLRFLHKMRDPMLERFFVTRLARVGHFLHNENLHLRAKIERTPEQQRFCLVCADALTKISEIRTADRERRARHDARAIFAKDHAPQYRRDIDGRRVQREKLRGLASALDPVNVFASALLQEDGNAVARIANPPAELVQFGLQKFIIRAFADVRDTRL